MRPPRELAHLLTDGLETFRAQAQFYQLLNRVAEQIQLGQERVLVADFEPGVREALERRRLTVAPAPEWAGRGGYVVTWS